MDSSDFPDWLLLRMQERGITQSELARRAGVSRQTISDYINRKRPYPDERILIKISDGLNIPPEEVFRAAGLLPQLPDIDMARKEIMEYKFSELTPDQQDDVIQFIEYLQAKGPPPGQKSITYQRSKRRQGEVPGEVVK